MYFNMLHAFLVFLGLVKPSVNHLQGKSENALNVFKDTVDNLTKINSTLTEHMDSKGAQIVALEADRKQIAGIHAANTKYVNKINEFLEV